MQKDIDREREKVTVVCVKCYAGSHYRYFVFQSQIAEERMQLAERKVIPLEKEFAKIKVIIASMSSNNLTFFCLQIERDQLLQKVITLESEFDTMAETASDAKRLLDDFVTSQKENVNLSSSVEALQQQITKQAEIVAKYESTAKQKEKEVFFIV